MRLSFFALPGSKVFKLKRKLKRILLKSLWDDKIYWDTDSTLSSCDYEIDGTSFTFKLDFSVVEVEVKGIHGKFTF